MHYLEISFVPRISTAKQLHGRNWVLDYLEILFNRAVSHYTLGPYTLLAICSGMLFFPHQPNLALALIVTDPCTHFFHDKYSVGIATKIRGSCNLPPCREKKRSFSYFLISSDL